MSPDEAVVRAAAMAALSRRAEKAEAQLASAYSQRDEAVKRGDIAKMKASELLENLGAMQEERDEARAEVERLRAALKSVAERQRAKDEELAGLYSAAAADSIHSTPLVTEAP